MAKSVIARKPKNNESRYMYLICFLCFFLLLAGLYTALYERPIDTTLSLLSSHRNTLSPITKDLLGENFNSSDQYDSCSSQYIYIHKIPSRFNVDVIKNCSALNKWWDMCKALMNGGFGPRIQNAGDALQGKSWYATDQYTLEVIFHNRMKQYRCLTNDSSLASAIYVPYYAGLDASRYLWDSNVSLKDALGLQFADWIHQQVEWQRMLGKDHFFLAGRVIWDFLRPIDKTSDWGNSLMLLPETKNLITLTVEADWERNSNIAIPWSTYFHPSTQREVINWQKKVKTRKRPYLYSFVGGPRPQMRESIRGLIIDQCLASGKRCKFVICEDITKNCRDPVYVMKPVMRSRFCLLPPGDSPTRRATFDSILGGCIPVFFKPESAYNQYVLHLPKNHSAYSVFIPESELREGKISIEKVLLRIPENEVLKMRDEVIGLIPKVIYVDKKPEFNTFEDAFDLAIKEVLKRANVARTMTDDYCS